MATTVRVWDLPTRVFHWALAACVVALVTTGQIGGNAMAWHFRFGYAMLCLLLFRFMWGLVGGHWSRFAAFIYAPATLVRYLKGHGLPEHSIGHNPLGAWSVFALLGFLLAQVASGLVSDDEIAAAGPFTKFVSDAAVRQATFYHTEVGKPVLLGLITLHVAAILFYLWKKRDNLLRPMLHGDKEVSCAVPGSRDDARSRAAAAALFLICAGLVTWLVKLVD